MGGGNFSRRQGTKKLKFPDLEVVKDYDFTVFKRFKIIRRVLDAESKDGTRAGVALQTKRGAPPWCKNL